MKFLFLFTLLLPFSLRAQWETPAVQCPEKILPQGLACPDFSGVENLWDEYPADMSAEEIREWKTHRAPDLKLCRYRELLRREEERSGTFTPLQVEIAWMITQGALRPQQKLQALMAASRLFSIPPHILLGALTQESLLASLGVSPDGGNYSCGIAQLNLPEWCQGMQTLTEAQRAGLHWPALACGSLSSTVVRPFYDIAVQRLNGRPAYQIRASDFAGITAAQVGLAPKTFEAVSSFLRHCQDDDLSIRFKAANLRKLFTQFVPAPLRRAETSATPVREESCVLQNETPYYPLHTGWLLAVAAYNAGPRVVGILKHYYQVQDDQFPDMTPKDLVEALHWGGKVRPGTNLVAFTGQSGKTQTQSWFKSCVVQRHVARVVQHVTKPGHTILESLEKVPCANGEVPLYRRNSSGIKE